MTAGRGACYAGGMDVSTPTRTRASSLPARLATAAVLAPVVIAGVWLGGEWVRLLAVAVGALCLIELYTAMLRAGVAPAWLPGGLGGLGVIVMYERPEMWGAAVAAVLACALWVAVAGGPRRPMRCVLSAAGVVYVGLPLALGLRLRAAPHGFEWCALVLAGVWLCDSAAYFVGSRFGRHKLLPQVSPKKSWEGFAAGLAAAALAALALSPFAALNPLLAPLAGLAIGLATVAGDLVESAIKRGLGVKDMGSLLPGHGGLLDRVDGLLLALPIGYLFATLLR